MGNPGGVEGGRNESMRGPGLVRAANLQHADNLEKGKGQAARMRGLSRKLLKL